MTGSQRRRRVLFIAHGHPAMRAGGAENYSLALHTAMRGTDWEPTLVARVGPPHAPGARPPGSWRVSPMQGASDQHGLYTDGYDYDWLSGTMREDKRLYTEHLRRLLHELRPDVVHFQHTLFIGYDAIREVRRTLPEAAIVYTLHEYLPICHNKGQLVRTFDGAQCDGESPARCARCFPDVSAESFALRKRFIQAQLGLVDLFIAPSRTLRDRFEQWGLPADRLVLEDYGTDAGSRAAAERPAPHRTFGFFGQLNPFKGIDLLLGAVADLTTGDALGVAPQLVVHGINLDLQERRFRERIAELRAACGDAVTWAGAYSPDRVGELMAEVDWVVVPSTWPENSPLVIHEAFASRRPVICSDTGGMAEKVQHDRTGLYFATGDRIDLARTIRLACDTDGLWERLSGGTQVVRPIGDHVEALIGLYEGALAGRDAIRVAA